jgi:hypothetical protein
MIYKKYEDKDASISKELCDNNLIQLSKCGRSDDTLFNLINFDNIQILKNLTLIIWTNGQEDRRLLQHSWCARNCQCSLFI